MNSKMGKKNIVGENPVKFRGGVEDVSSTGRRPSVIARKNNKT